MQPNEQPINTAPIASPVIDVPQKNSKNRGLIIALIICIVLACGGVGFGLYEYFKNRDLKPANDTTASNQNTTPVADVDTSLEDVQAIVDLIANDISSKLSGKLIYDKNYNNAASSLIAVDDVSTFADKSIGFKLNVDYIDFLSEPGQTKANTFNFDDILNTIKATFNANDFTSLHTDGAGNTLFYNSAKNIYCKLPSNLPHDITFLSCASGSWISPERAELVKAVRESLGRTDSRYDNLPYVFIYATEDDIEDSSVAPYQRLVAGSFNANLLLYRVSEDSEWHFITETQTFPYCDKFNDDAKKAYAGTKCRTADVTEITL